MKNEIYILYNRNRGDEQDRPPNDEEAAQGRFMATVKNILKTKLTPNNKILVINMMKTPKIQFSFGIIDWSQYEINTIDIQTRKLLCQNKIFYKESKPCTTILVRLPGSKI